MALTPVQVARRKEMVALGKTLPAGPSRQPSVVEHAAATAGEAKAATGLALESGRAADAGRALALRSEARVAAVVADWRRPDVGGDAGPRGPGRGALEAGTVAVMTYDPRDDAMRPTDTRVVRRAVPRVVAQLPADERATAERYQLLMERVGAIRCVDLAGGGGSRSCYDGGAAVRWDNDGLRADAERRIGDGVALAPRTLAGDRRAITDRTVVEAILLRGITVREILAWHGWSRKAEHERAIVEALRAALRRMMMVIG